MKPALLERNREICHLIETSDLTYKAIGAQFGISMQRVQEIAIRDRHRAVRDRARALDATRPLVDRSVEFLPLADYVRRSLIAAGIATVGDLLAWDAPELASLDNIGRQAMKQLHAYFTAEGHPDAEKYRARR